MICVTWKFSTFANVYKSGYGFELYQTQNTILIKRGTDIESVCKQEPVIDRPPNHLKWGVNYLGICCIGDREDAGDHFLFIIPVRFNQNVSAM